MTRLFCVAMLLTLGVALPGGLAAQPRTEWFVGAGAGFGWGSLLVGSGDPDIGTGSGGLAVLQAGLARSGRRTWMLEAEAQLFDVPSPVADERFRTYRASVRRSIGAPFYLAPGLGVEYRRWKGEGRSEDSDVGLLVALAIGRHVALDGPLALIPEISWSYSPLDLDGAVNRVGVTLRLSAIRLIG